MLRLNESDLNTQRMFDLMAVREGAMPLYLYVIQRILRDLRIKQQESGTTFNYSEFKRMIEAERLTRDQLVHLGQRLDTLESFMVKEDVFATMKGEVGSRSGTNWSPKVSLRKQTLITGKGLHTDNWLPFLGGPADNRGLVMPMCDSGDGLLLV